MATIKLVVFNSPTQSEIEMATKALTTKRDRVQVVTCRTAKDLARIKSLEGVNFLAGPGRGITPDAFLQWLASVPAKKVVEDIMVVVIDAPGAKPTPSGFWEAMYKAAAKKR